MFCLLAKGDLPHFPANLALQVMFSLGRYCAEFAQGYFDKGILGYRTLNGFRKKGKCTHGKIIWLSQSCMCVYKASRLAFKVAIFASASASFLRSLAITCSGALLTKRSLLNFFCTDFKKPSV